MTETINIHEKPERRGSFRKESIVFSQPWSVILNEDHWGFMVEPKKKTVKKIPINFGMLNTPNFLGKTSEILMVAD